MKKTYFKRAIASMLLLCCLSLTSVYADVTQDDIDDAKEQVDDLQNQVEDAKNELNEINNKKDKLEGDLKNLNGNLQALAEDMNELEEDISAKQEEIAEKKKQLESEETELLALKEELEAKQKEVSSLIAATESNISKTKTEIASAEENKKDLEEKLKYWKEYEKELEAQKIKEDLARWEEIQNMEKEDWSGVEYVPKDGEAYLLAAIIQCESDGEPYEGKLAVGSVVMNRVRSSSFPNTITGVIYQKNQFAPVASGRLAYRLEAGVNDTCKRAALEVLNGNITNNCLFFRTVVPGIDGTIIGNHIFY